MPAYRTERRIIQIDLNPEPATDIRRRRHIGCRHVNAVYGKVFKDGRQ
jgi:hypothetical protein